MVAVYTVEASLNTGTLPVLPKTLNTVHTKVLACYCFIQNPGKADMRVNCFWIKATDSITNAGHWVTFNEKGFIICNFPNYKSPKTILITNLLIVWIQKF